MKIRSFSSGSKGNCSYIEGNDKKILIDAGISYHRILSSLKNLSLTIDDIDALFITHTHKDHIAGLEVLAKHAPLKIYIQEGIYKEVKNILPREKVEFITPQVTLGTMTIQSFPTSHDALFSCGFLIEEDENSLVYVTDTGYIPRKYLNQLTNKTVYFFETNHDEEMLMNGSYPYYLKQRVLGDKGHLSNRLAASYLKFLIGDNTKEIILAHLSEHNNDEELAVKTVLSEVEKTSYRPHITVAKQNVESILIEV